MGKIGDLFVRLGLKKDDFSRGLAQAKAETKGFAEQMGGAFSKVKAVGVAIWTAIGAAAIKTFSEVIQHSQRFGDAWNNTMNGCKAAWSSFLTSLTNWDWNGFGDKMRDAMNAGKASSAAHDAAFEVENSIKLRKAKMREELALLRVEMMNQNLSYDERVKAAESYLAKVKPLYDEEIALRQKLRVADLNEWLASNGFAQSTDNRDLVEQLLTNIAPNESLMNALDKETRKNSGKKVDISSEDQRILNEFFANYGARVGGTLAAMASAYIGSGDEETKKIVDAINGLYEAQALFDEETRRIQNVKNTASAQIGTTASVSNTPSANPGLESAFAHVEAAFASMNRKMQYEKEQSAQIEQEWLEDFNAFSEELQPMLDKIQDGINGIDVTGIADKANTMQIIMEDLIHALEDGLISAFDELANVIAGVDNADFASVAKALLSPLADMAIKAGTIIMMSGEAMEALKAALESGGMAGMAAVVAGAGLIAVGIAAKAGLAAINKGGSTSATTTSSASSSSYGSSGVASAELTVYVKGSIKGSDIYLSGQNTLTEWSK